MTDEQQLRAKLRKITALFEGAATAGERQAAAAAIERIKRALDAAIKTQPLPETKFRMADQWQRRLFLALCRRYGLEPYRYRGQRYTTVVLRAPRAFIDKLSGRNTSSCSRRFMLISTKPPNESFAKRSSTTLTKPRNGQDKG